MKRKEVRKREGKKSYGEMDGKSSDLRSAVFTGRVKIDFPKLDTAALSVTTNQ